MISAITHIARLGPRRLRVRARRRVRRWSIRALVPPHAQLALRIARLIERPGAKSGPRVIARADAAWTGLSQAWTVSCHPARRGRRHHGARPGKPAGPIAAVSARPRPKPPSALSLDRPIAQAFASFGPAVAAASIAQVHRGETERDGVRTSVAIKVLRPNVAARFRIATSPISFLSRTRPRPGRRKPAGCG